MMLCAERDSLLREHRAAFQLLHASLVVLVVLVDNSATESEFKLAHVRIRYNRGACEVARAALERHQLEHGC
jgi:hypothetical protein